MEPVSPQESIVPLPTQPVPEAPRAPGNFAAIVAANLAIYALLQLPAVAILAGWQPDEALVLLLLTLTVLAQPAVLLVCAVASLIRKSHASASAFGVSLAAALLLSFLGTWGVTSAAIAGVGALLVWLFRRAIDARIAAAAAKPLAAPGAGGPKFWRWNFAVMFSYVLIALAALGVSEDTGLLVYWLGTAAHALGLFLFAVISLLRGRWRDAGVLVLLTIALPLVSCGTFCLSAAGLGVF